MSAFLTKEVLPSDEIEVPKTIANAPFYAVDEGAGESHQRQGTQAAY